MPYLHLHVGNQVPPYWGDHTLLRKYIYLLEKSQLSQLLPGITWAEIPLVSLEHPHGTALCSVGSCILECNMNPFCTCLLQQLEFNAVAELLFHTGGVNGIKIQVWRAGRFVFGFDTHGIHPQH